MTRARYVSNPQAIDIPLTVSANLTANAVITVGNSSVNSVISSNTYSIGSNVSLNTSRLFLGNSTVNSVHTASTLDVGANVNLSTVGLNVGSNTVNAYITSTSFAIGNSTVNTAITSTTITSTALLSIGNTNVTGTANVSTGINVGANVNLSTSQISVGNSTVNTTITNITVSTNTVNVASIINIGANVNLSTSQINIGNSTVNTVISATALTTTSNTVSIGTAAYFVANGNLGIGTSSPAQTLHVKTSTSVTPITLGVLSNATGLPALSFNGAYASTTMAGIYGNGATASNLYYEVPSGQNHYFGIADVTKMTLDSSGNLLLGSTSLRSSAKLDILGETIALGGNVTYYGTIGYNAGTGLLSLAAESGGHIRFLSGATALARFTSTGDLLLNETSKNASWGKQVLISDTDYPALVLKATRATNGRQYIVGLDGTGGGQSYLSFHDHTAGATRMVIDYSGCVGIGVTTPITFAKLAIRSAVTATIGTTSTTGVAFSCSDAVNSTFYISHNNAAVNLHSDSNFCFYGPNAGPNVERMRINTSGHLMVGTSSYLPGITSGGTYKQTVADYVYSFWCSNVNPYGIYLKYETDINNTGNEIFTAACGTTVRFVVRSNGGIANYSASNVNLSDRREKINFAPAKAYLDIICAIPVQTFNYIDQNLEDDPGLTLGVVAQDVQVVAPELVSESNWGTKEDPKMRLSIYQTDLQYALMKCIQEQQALITQLQADVAELKSR